MEVVSFERDGFGVGHGGFSQNLCGNGHAFIYSGGGSRMIRFQRDCLVTAGRPSPTG